MRHPHFGHTRQGLAVHASVLDHHPDDTAYQRFNKRVAVLLTKGMGSMTAFWVFTVLCLLVLPSVLYAMGIKHIAGVPSFMLGFGFELLMTWFLSTFLELVLMPAIMVGQNLQNAASDARSAKQFEDTEVIADRLDTATRGGITEILTAVNAQRDDIAGLAELLRAVLADHRQALTAALDVPQKLLDDIKNRPPRKAGG